MTKESTSFFHKRFSDSFYPYTGKIMISQIISKVNPYSGNLTVFHCYHHIDPKTGNDMDEGNLWSILKFM